MENNIEYSKTASPYKTTTVVLRGVICGADGQPISLVSYLGVNYLEDSFIKHAMRLVNPQYYTRTPDGDKKYPDGTPVYVYTQISENDVELAEDTRHEENGTVKLVVKGNPQLFTNLQEKEVQPEEGEAYKKLEAEAADLANVNSKLATATEGSSNMAVRHPSGATYYPIPVAHLNQPKVTEGATEDPDVIEGQFGVVRNHVYNIRISKVNGIGLGVFDPNVEKIDPPTSTSPTYFVESTINILSWKVVSITEEI